MHILGDIIFYFFKTILYVLFAAMVASPFYLIWFLTDFDVLQKSFSSLFFVIIDLIVVVVFFRKKSY